MPYTPPSQRSPAISTATTPSLSRRSSYQPGPPPRAPGAASLRPELPRSSSYLTRHRRTPSAKVVDDAASTEQHERLHVLTSSGSLRQSPPPRTDETQVPAGAVLSPPDSAQNSSDDEGVHDRGALKLENLAELQEAIRVLAEKEAQAGEHTAGLDKAEEVVASALHADAEPRQSQSVAQVAAALPREVRRKITHARANTDTGVLLEMRTSPEFSTTNSDEDSISDEDGGTRMRPPMLRKKSGELVRPALRPASARRRPSSMPGTPTFNTHKAVHFDNKLEHVRHFLQVDRPLAVSAGSSPVESHDTDTEFPFHEEPRGPPFEWELVLANFPAETPQRLAQPVRVERVYLSADNKTMMGAVAVANLAFNKLVVARFTLDYWKTTSEVVAEYNNDIRQPKRSDGYDRFNFNIKLADLANLEAKTMFFCVKFVVNGQEHWDNNNATNFQIDFRKKAVPQHGKRGLQPASARSPNSGLPRSHKKSGMPRNVAHPAFDDFGDGFDPRDFKQPVDLLLGEPAPKLRLPGVKSALNLPARGSPPSSQAFGTRYDFGASLHAAKTHAIAALGERSGIVMKPSPSPVRTPARYVPNSDETTSPLSVTSTEFGRSAPRNFTPAPLAMTDPARLASTDKPPLQSSSYTELLDKYCFYGTKATTVPGKDKTSNYDGATDNYALGSVESSTNSSPITMAPAKKRVVEGASNGRTSPVSATGFAPGSSSSMHGYPRVDQSWGGAATATAIQG